MNAYMVSWLALNAGVSVCIVHGYLLHGLLRPVTCTSDGYGLLDEAILQRLCFVQSTLGVDISLSALARLFRTLDVADDGRTTTRLAVLYQLVERRRKTLINLEAQLTTLPIEPTQHVGSLP